MKIGVCLPQLGPAAGMPLLADFAVQAEGSGVDSLWVEEHLFRPLDPITGFGGVDGMPWPDEHAIALAPLETLAFVAAKTTTCRLGTSILVTGYHHPLMLAKEAATIDVLSGGRMNLGLGVGWCEDEYQLVGQPFKKRGAIADEMLEALRVCWGPNPAEFHGEHVEIPVCETSPKPANGHLPIHGGFLAGAGLRRVARWCDVWQPFGLDPTDAVERLGRLNEVAVTEHGRSPLDLALRVLIAPGPRSESGALAGPMGKSTGRWAGSIDQLAERVAAAREAGLGELIMDPNFAPGADSTSFWETLADDITLLVAAAHG